MLVNENLPEYCSTSNMHNFNWHPVTVNFAPSGGPSPRAGHTLTYNPNNNECVLFGGASHEDGLYDDIYRLDVGQ